MFQNLKTMRAIIPVAGAGIRLRPLTYTQPKPLIPVGGKSILAFIIDELVDVGIDDFVFIIGYLGDKIKNYVEDHYPDLKVEFVIQEERLGLGHAIWTARDAINGADEILIALGDTIFELDLKEMMAMDTSCFGVQKVDDPRNFGVVEIGDNGFVTRVVEKPVIPKSNLAMVGLYKIKEVEELIDAIDFNIKNDIRTVDEFQLTDGLMRMIDNSVKFSTIKLNKWFDCGKKDILLETNKILLQNGNFEQNDQNYTNSIIISPVSMGPNCKIENSIIGPHVTIGGDVIIIASIIKDSIIGDFSQIEEAVLKKSIIGNDAAIRGLAQSLNIGDNTEIDFSR